MRLLAALALLSVALRAEDPKPAAEGRAGTEFQSAELGLRFNGVYGWTTEIAAGGGAWTQLAKYSEPAYGAVLLLQVRTSPYSSLEAMREGLRSEFAASAAADPKPGAPVLREIVFRDVEMKGGSRLPGIQVEAVALQVDPDGKKRELNLLVRTFLGKTRLYRIHASASRTRYAKVADLFTRAADSLVVTATDERGGAGQEFQSVRGGYACLVPDGFRVVLPRADSTADIRFENAAAGLYVHVFSYFLEGDLATHLDQLRQFYGEALQVTSEEAKVFGGDGFTAKVVKDDRVTLMAGAYRTGRAVRVHALAGKGKEAEAQALLDAFLRGFRMEEK